MITTVITILTSCKKEEAKTTPDQSSIKIATAIPIDSNSFFISGGAFSNTYVDLNDSSMGNYFDSTVFGGLYDITDLRSIRYSTYDQFYMDIQGCNSLGTYTISSALGNASGLIISVNGLSLSSSSTTTNITVNITQFGNVGQKIIGTYLGSIIDGLTTYTLTGGQFSIRRQ